MLLMLLLGFGSLSLTFSRVHPMTEAIVAILGAHYLVINTTCWNAFLLTAAWEGGEEFFRFGMTHFLAAVSFYIGIAVAVSLLCALASALRQNNGYSRRQKLMFSVASLVILSGIIVSLLTPIALQRLLDLQETAS